MSILSELELSFDEVNALVTENEKHFTEKERHLAAMMCQQAGLLQANAYELLNAATTIASSMTLLIEASKKKIPANVIPINR